MFRHLRNYEIGPWTICDAMAICLALVIGVGCVGCVDELEIVLGGGGNPNPVFVPTPIYSPPPVYDPCHSGCHDDYVVIDVGWGW